MVVECCCEGGDNRLTPLLAAGRSQSPARTSEPASHGSSSPANSHRCQASGTALGSKIAARVTDMDLARVGQASPLVEIVSKTRRRISKQAFFQPQNVQLCPITPFRETMLLTESRHEG